ncbi:Hypothetical predicted protein [Paramuricea clavata]|uniref:Uncharacterized protein n=1 Tax=Paramuricea clavata TaxID=317549 RepID=A0A6S7G279_PARCT|nr:Hypothetical predicted protein [Paramuricea clavata]
MGDDAIINQFLHTFCANAHIQHCMHKCDHALTGIGKDDNEIAFKQRFCGSCHFGMFEEYSATHKREEDEKSGKLNDDDQFVFTGFATLDGKQFQYKHLNTKTMFYSRQQTVEQAGEEWLAENPGRAWFEVVTVVKDGVEIQQKRKKSSVFMSGTASGSESYGKRKKETKLRQATLFEFYKQE